MVMLILKATSFFVAPNNLTEQIKNLVNNRYLIYTCKKTERFQSLLPIVIMFMPTKAIDYG
jgi:hypothetical protein